ncbi:MAG: 2-phosphosulfolactate phosphatase [Bacteroidales bacterium]|nr:2-phosphosulfolactate phosphatase [Bacteroidales bacterium]
MNNIEVCITPKLFDQYSLSNKIVVIVDVLRATTIITTMFHQGLKKLIPVKDLDEAKKYKEKGYLISAERNGKKIDFADFGNSPFDYTPENIKDRTLVYSTTNGTNTINIAKKSEMVLIASFLNFTSIADYLISQKKDVLILCSGWKGDFCTEDFLFAGALSEKLILSKNYFTESDSVLSSIDIWNLSKTDLLKYIKNIFQYKRLIDFGFKDIINYCFQIDITDVIPVLKEDYIIDLKKITSF